MRFIKAGGLVCLIAVSPASVSADIYEWKDDAGRPHYSDRQRDAARVVKIDTRPNGSTSFFHPRVKRVFDGDTVMLENGERVRLLGINTPEVAGRNKSAEAGGEAAKVWLTERLRDQRIRLEGDVEAQDRYQRKLAHVFTEDGTHINLELVRRGLAAVAIHPPNYRYADALLAAQREAEQKRLGIWQSPDYAPILADTINLDNYKGWKRVRGRIRAIKHSRKYSYLQINERFSLRVAKEAGVRFPDLQNWQGRSVEARGWINKSGERLTLDIPHPAALQFLD